jgi:hypothetical protein
MAGGTRANPAAVVIEVHIVFLGQFENGLVYKIAFHRFRGDAGIFKLKLDNCHKTGGQNSFRCLLNENGAQR